MKAAVARHGMTDGPAPRREIECSYDFEADIYSAPRAQWGRNILPVVIPAMMFALLAAFRLR